MSFSEGFRAGFTGESIADQQAKKAAVTQKADESALRKQQAKLQIIELTGARDKRELSESADLLRSANIMFQQTGDINAAKETLLRYSQAASGDGRSMEGITRILNATGEDFSMTLNNAESSMVGLGLLTPRTEDHKKFMGLETVKPVSDKEKAETAYKVAQTAALTKKDTAGDEVKGLELQLTKLKIATEKAKQAKTEQEKNNLLREVETEKKDIDFQATEAINTFQYTADTIGRMLTMGEGGKALERSAGIFSGLMTFGGTEAAGFEAALETLQSQLFLSQIEKMSGMGTLSENEGKKLAMSIGALDLSMKDKDLRSEFVRIRNVLIDAKSAMEKKYGRTPVAQKNDTPASNNQLSTRDAQALEWANQNSNDPRAAAIIQRLR